MSGFKKLHQYKQIIPNRNNLFVLMKFFFFLKKSNYPYKNYLNLIKTTSDSNLNVNL